ncbi:DUF3572 family protein [Sphingomonas solaris]|uniref:DUF3572 family protein n=1 Tax=Alterirhizorhabdus solaris TaxID=2529389 RepID=A0A558R8B4_9SPHN|nr:DUF3572 family protein [Sphingomonas solaris]TVV75641.1 DUF3572 family protein [Sphingomonas solaris]
MRTDKVSHDPTALALSALAWAVSDVERATRLLALTGLAPDDLRQRAADREVLAAVLGFLESHQPDLIACADALEVRPESLVTAREELER